MTRDATRDGLRDGLRDAPRDVPHTTPHHTTERTTSSRTDAQRGRRLVEESVTSRIRRVPQADALARLIADIRPDWSVAEVHAWALRDERPWADVVAAGINGARDRNVRQVGGLAFTGPVAATVAQTYPTVAEALNPELCDAHGSAIPCPFCRQEKP